MSVNANSLITLEYLKQHMGLADTDILVPGLTVFHDASVSATAATVQVTNTTLILIITGGANAGTTTLTLADVANDTLGELATVINALGTGWIAHAVGKDSAATGDLMETAAKDALAEGNTQTLQIVDNDRFERLIDACSVRIEDYLRRQIKTRSYVQYLDGNGQTRMLLPKFPVTALKLSVGRLDAIEIECTATDASTATVRMTPTTLDSNDEVQNATALEVVLTITGGASELTTTLTLSETANDTLTELVAVIAALSGWSATLKLTAGAAGSRRSADLIPRESVQALAGNPYTAHVSNETAWPYHLQKTPGLLTSRKWPFAGENIRAEYTAGFTTVPESIQIATAQYCKDVYDASLRDGGLKSERTATYSYTVETAKGTPLTDSVRELLGDYVAEAWR